VTVERLPGTPYASGEGRIARSWRLTRAAWRVVGYDDTLKGLAVLGALAGLAGFALLLVLGGVFSGARVSRGHILLVAALLAYPLTFISVFVNTAIAAAAASALQGQRLSTRQALAVAYGRVGRIAVWALIAALVGLLIEQVASRLPAGGSIVARIAGYGWSLASLFAIPILALEDCSPVDCLKRSAGLVRERWGEGIAGGIIITAWTTIAILLLGVAAAVAIPAAGSTGAMIFFAVLAGLALVAILAAQSVVRQTFVVALYRYATTGTAEGPFTEQDLSAPFTPKRGRSLS
jgi:Family of unknown function (DUF6159)